MSTHKSDDGSVPTTPTSATRSAAGSEHSRAGSDATLSPQRPAPPSLKTAQSQTALGLGIPPSIAEEGDAAPPVTPGPSAPQGLKGKGVATRKRSKSRVRVPIPRDDDDEEPGSGGADEKADDEFERRDRGEELVRRRMKDRARVKKEAEKVRKRQLDAARRASYMPDQPEEAYDQILRGAGPASAPLTGPSSFMGGSARSRDPSRSGVRDSFAPSDLSTSYGDEWRSFSPGPPGFTLGGIRNTSYAASVSTQGGGDNDFFDERGFATPGPPTAASAGPERGEYFGQFPSDRESVQNRSMSQSGEPTPADDEDEEEEDDEDDDDNQDVEYTLKDRQDAINIEHPFGLPIWKPALYKKSRSVTRNAETALHATPSSTALRHLAPGNILWTLFFGSWLAVVCAVVSAVLWCVPWGGGKYGRVIWELGGYLFWPFGKYVEGWSDGGVEDDDEDEEHNDAVVTESDEDEEEEGEDYQGTPGGRKLDVENAGRTLGRGRSRIISGASSGHHSASQIWENPSAVDPLPDEPRSRSIINTTRVSSGESTTVVASPSGRSADGGNSTPRQASATTARGPSSEHTALLLQTQSQPSNYGTSSPPKDKNRSSSDDTISGLRPHDFSKDSPRRVRALGRSMYWVGFYLVVAPLMLFVCILCWAMVFTIPMAKLLWVLLRHLNNEPLSLHFRSPPKYTTSPPSTVVDGETEPVGPGGGTTSSPSGIHYPLRAGDRAPPVSKKSVRVAKAHGRLFGPRSTVLLCTYRAAGLQYYKYTIDGVNILFINLMSLVFFVIADFFFLLPYVEKHEKGGFLGLIAGQAFIFVTALLSVIPLSYFIGMAVASISAQSSIGMGAVINASFGSIIEIILYCIALTQSKAELVEGSIVGSLLAGVLLMPGASMIGGAMRRKEQKFNAKSAGVTSTMLIMAIIGILTPTLFYEIYGSFQLTCTGCDPDRSGTTTSCKTCYYEHVDPVDDPFYKGSVRLLSYWCAAILVLSYLIGLWFSLRTHASQIWQNAQAANPEHGLVRPLSGAAPGGPDNRMSLYKRMVPGQLLKRRNSTTPGATPALGPRSQSQAPGNKVEQIPGIELPQGLTVEDLSRAFEVVAATADTIRARAPVHARQASHVREISGQKDKEEEEGGHGGHDAPNWSRMKSASVLMGCTMLYAVIAEILVDVVDVVLDGSGIPEKFLGVTLFALVPNTTEFMNAISFAINGNIALSMEIGSAYALQVCLIQAPAMLAFSAYYGIGKDYLHNISFTLVFPRWDVIAIMFSVFLLTYTYIEARANYYRGSILCLSYFVLLGGFAFAPAANVANPAPGSFSVPSTPILSWLDTAQAIFLSLWTH